MPSDYGQRAAIALDLLIPAQHRDKSVARLFGVSVRFAKYLRRGQFWTIDRLNQASRMLDGFDAYIASPDRLEAIRMDMDELDRRLAALEQERAREDAREGEVLAMARSGDRSAPRQRGVGMVREDAPPPVPAGVER